MDKFINELNDGKVDFLENLSSYNIDSYDRKNTIPELINNCKNKKEILDKVLTIFLEKEVWYDLSYGIFKHIYLDKDYKDYTYFLLHKELVRLEDFESEVIKNLLEQTNWGFDYILNNLEKSNNRTNIIKELVNYTKDKEELYQIILEKIMTFNNQEIRDYFLIVSLNRNILLTEDNIKANLYKNTGDYYYHQEKLPFIEEESLLTQSRLPLFLAIKSKKNDNIKNIIINNLDLFLKVESTNKMEFIEYFYDYLSKETLEKYINIYKLYKTQPTNQTDENLTILLNNNMYELLNDLLKDKEISYLSSGTTTQAFKVGNLVLKLSREKHEINTEKDLFLIVKTATKYIYDTNNNPLLILEIQKYLEKSYNNQKMTLEDINNFFRELDNLGYTLTDPLCCQKSFDNFGFLEDYHDANLVGFNSYEELPEWFKLRPIVLYDVDLVYKKDVEKKKTFNR